MKPENETKITMRENRNKNKSKVQEELFKVGQYIPKFNDILRKLTFSNKAGWKYAMSICG